MISHENCLLADDSHEKLYPIFLENQKSCRQKLLSAAVSALRVKMEWFMN